MSRRAARLGIETQYRDVQGRPQMADPQALARVTAALAGSQQPARRLLPATVILRDDRDLRLRLKTGARTAVRWEILPEANGSDAPDAVIAAGTAVASVIALPADLPLGSYRLKVAAQSAGKERVEEATLAARARPGLSGAGERAAAPVGAGGAALWGAVAAQLGPWRLHRSHRPRRACGRARRRRRCAQSLACFVRRSRRGREPVLAQQPAVSQPALHRCRRDPGISRACGRRARARGGGAVAARIGRLRGRGARQDAGAGAGLRKVSWRRCGAPRGVRRLPARARSRPGAVCLL